MKLLPKDLNAPVSNTNTPTLVLDTLSWCLKSPSPSSLSLWLDMIRADSTSPKETSKAHFLAPNLSSSLNFMPFSFSVRKVPLVFRSIFKLTHTLFS